MQWKDNASNIHCIKLYVSMYDKGTEKHHTNNKNQTTNPKTPTNPTPICAKSTGNHKLMPLVTIVPSSSQTSLNNNQRKHHWLHCVVKERFTKGDYEDGSTENNHDVNQQEVTNGNKNSESFDNGAL